MILIVAKNKRDADAFIQSFHFMGILAYYSSPSTALSEIGKGFHSALFVGDELSEYEELVRAMRSYSLDCPIFALSKSEERRYTFFDAEFFWSGYVSELACKIINYQKDRRLPVIGEYRVAGIDASCHKTNVLYYGREIHLTKTEAMILRYLIATYPIPQKASNILKYAFRPGRMPEITNIRTHICVINSKFNDEFSRTVISSEPRVGYTVLTPENIKV